MRDECFEEVSSIIASTLGIEQARVTPELNAEAVDEWDSLNHLRLITAVEKHFKIRMTMAEVMSLAKVDDLVAIVQRHRALDGNS